MKRIIFVVGLSDFYRKLLETIPDACQHDFLELIPKSRIVGTETFPIDEYLAEAEKIFEGHTDEIDGIIGFWDFPTSTLLPLLRQRAGLDGPSLEAVLRCEHKYWARLCQQRAVPDMVPRFEAVDPFAETADVSLPYPFWLKPVKAHSSHLGFMVRNDNDLAAALEATRARIERFAKPFNAILAHAQLPAEIAQIDGWHCIAEEIISAGRQCTLEGYVYNGETTVYGVVDSIRAPNRTSFTRYQYPSSIPGRVTERMAAAAGRVMRETGYDMAPFNAEFFWDDATEEIKLLEVNTRVSKSHAPLFHMVDGAAHFAIAVALAQEQKPEFPHRQGAHRVAAKFMLRAGDEAKVVRLPRRTDWDRLRKRFPDMLYNVFVTEGMDLAEMHDQDSYTYEIAEIFLGAENQSELLAKYDQALSMLPFEFDREVRIA